MDRLICGDVGFGKTEVALRTAFLAVMEGYQVAIVAPTTLLARQHFKTFSDRFKGFNIKVGHLSRLVSSKNQKLTREEAARGGRAFGRLTTQVSASSPSLGKIPSASRSSWVAV